MIIDRLDGLNISALPRMVRWFDPILLAQIGVRAIISSVFGQYADQRAMQAAVDPIDQQSLVSRYDYSHELTPDASGAIWVDFVADLGDGFDSTYAIASLLAKPAIAFEGVPDGSKPSTIPRAHRTRPTTIASIGSSPCRPATVRESARC